MKLLHLILANLRHHKVRTVLTVLGILVAFLLYGLLSAIDKGFNAGVDLAGNDRLVLQHRVSLIQPLPYSYGPRMEQVDGVVFATHASWFGGVYQEPKNFFPKIAVDPEPFLRMYPEYVLPEEQKKAWFATRTGAIAGKDLAERFGWEVGDTIPVQGDIWMRADGSRLWEFDLVGIYEGASQDADQSQFFFQYDYLVEGTGGQLGQVGWYWIRIDEPDLAPQIAENIDALFANSPAETKTTTEKAFGQAFAQQVGNTTAIVRGVVAAVFFTLLLVVGNTMAQSVRERTNELAVLKALGFRDGTVMRLVIAEACALAMLGGLLGLGFAAVLTVPLGKALSGFLPVFYIPMEAQLVGLGLMLLLGLITGVPPAIQAMRLQVSQALRRV
ncbi:MAG: FtsX-like permease family protein [Acidobacteriota bacterium]|nr:FtsX-like permease family protein [Acidobacteriota bacterium]